MENSISIVPAANGYTVTVFSPTQETDDPGVREWVPPKTYVFNSLNQTMEFVTSMAAKLFNLTNPTD